MRLLPSGRNRALTNPTTTILADPPRGRRPRIGLVLFIFVAFGGLLLWGAARDVRQVDPTAADPNPVAITTPDISDYVLLQEDRVAAAGEIERLRADRQAIDAQIDALNAEWLQATNERREEILLESQRLDNERKALTITIDQREANVAHYVAQANAEATAEAQRLAIHAEATRAAIDNIEWQAVAVERQARARSAALAYYGAAGLVIAAAIIMIVLALPYVIQAGRDIWSLWRQPVPNGDQLAGELWHGDVGPPPRGRPVREPLRTGQNRSRTGGDTLENRSRTVPEPERTVLGTVPEEPAERLDATHPPTAEERAMIRRWFNRLQSKTAVCNTLYGYKNPNTWRYVNEAIAEGERA